jgi:HSP20 family protein
VAISKWARFGAFTELEQEMHTLLDHFGGRPWLEGFGWRPDTDIRREGSALVIEMDLPGIDPAHDLEIVAVDNMLSIQGERLVSADIAESDLLVQERRSGRFHRNVMLPDGVVGDLIDAVYDNGTLTVRIPIPDLPDSITQPHQIPVHGAG